MRIHNINNKTIQIHGYPVFNNRDDVVQVIVFEIDITKLRQWEKINRNLILTGRTVLNAVEEGVLLIR